MDHAIRSLVQIHQHNIILSHGDAVPFGQNSVTDDHQQEKKRNSKTNPRLRQMMERLVNLEGGFLVQHPGRDFVTKMERAGKILCA